jgi:type IV secretory pathway TrbD component
VTNRPGPSLLGGSRDVEAHVVHASLVRPVLLAGAEPAAVMIEVTTAFALVFVVGFHVVTVLVALFYLTIVHSLMVWVATQDPQMTAMYFRSLTSRDFYPPHGVVTHTAPRVRPSFPGEP